MINILIKSYIFVKLLPRDDGGQLKSMNLVFPKLEQKIKDSIYSEIAIEIEREQKATSVSKRKE